jgi:hypothetical protein
MASQSLGVRIGICLSFGLSFPVVLGRVSDNVHILHFILNVSHCNLERIYYSRLLGLAIELQLSLRT